ncbi:MAG: hypothetical protein ACE5QW_06595 [Thermoplasmata archaeon]
MAEIKTKEEILRKLARKYEKNPRGWSVLVRENRSGYSDFLISTADELWQIKVDSLYKPNASAMGMKVGGRTEARKIAFDSEPKFGFRPLPPDILDKLLGGEFERQELTRIIDRVLGEEPKRLSEIDSPGLIHGPVRFGWKGYLSERQKLLDAKLKKGLDKLLFEEGFGFSHA